LIVAVVKNTLIFLAEAMRGYRRSCVHSHVFTVK